jgi:cysteine-rich repeat protein
MTEHPDPNYPGCIEICGDGFNFGMVECDDGNLMNGDGCTSKCFIEKGWNCTGGSPYMPDTCRDIQSPTPKISLINKRNQVYISFDEEVILTEDLNQEPPKFTITVTGQQPFYKFDWEVPPYIVAGEHLQSMVINLNFGMSLRGTEKLTLRFLSAGTFQDLAGNGIVLVPLPGQLSKFKYLDPFWSNSIYKTCR